MYKYIEISLIITAIYVSFSEGMILSNVRVVISNWLDTFFPVLKKPLFDCLICMGGIWTLIIYPILFGIDVEIIKAVLIVIGLNTIIDKIIHYE